VVDKHLAKAIVDMAIFLEYSSEDVLDADAAVGAMEQLSAELQLMSDEDRASLNQCFRELADSYGGRANFVKGLIESLGLGSQA
jgi:hypothetical protein